MTHTNSTHAYTHDVNQTLSSIEEKIYEPEERKSKRKKCVEETKTKPLNKIGLNIDKARKENKGKEVLLKF